MDTFRSEAHVETADSARYIRRLCKHFAHKVDATYTDEIGQVDFPFGRCTLEAMSNRLTLQAAADDADALQRVQDVVGSHLKQFAKGREDLVVTWRSTNNHPPL